MDIKAADVTKRCRPTDYELCTSFCLHT